MTIIRTNTQGKPGLMIAHNSQKMNGSYRWGAVIPFVQLHIALAGVFFFPFSWKLVAFALAAYVIRMFNSYGRLSPLLQPSLL